AQESTAHAAVGSGVPSGPKKWKPTAPITTAATTKATTDQIQSRAVFLPPRPPRPARAPRPLRPPVCSRSSGPVCAVATGPDCGAPACRDTKGAEGTWPEESPPGAYCPGGVGEDGRFGGNWPDENGPAGNWPDRGRPPDGGELSESWRGTPPVLGRSCLRRRSGWCSGKPASGDTGEGMGGTLATSACPAKGLRYFRRD